MRLCTATSRPTVLASLLVSLGACGASRHHPPAEPTNPARPEAESAGDADHQALTAGTEAVVSIKFKNCVNGKTLAATLALTASDTDRAILSTRMDPNATSDCVRNVQVAVPALDAGDYDLHVKVTGSTTADSEDRHVKLTAKAVERPSPDKPKPSSPAASDDKWPNEKLPEVDCDGQTCEQRITAHLGLQAGKNTTVKIYRSMDTREVSGHLHLQSQPDNAAKGTFTLDGPDFSVPQSFNKGDFEVRKGRLALRSSDKSTAYYFRWYSVNDNGSQTIYLFGELPVGSGPADNANIR